MHSNYFLFKGVLCEAAATFSPACAAKGKKVLTLLRKRRGRMVLLWLFPNFIIPNCTPLKEFCYPPCLAFWGALQRKTSVGRNRHHFCVCSSVGVRATDILTAKERQVLLRCLLSSSNSVPVPSFLWQSWLTHSMPLRMAGGKEMAHSRGWQVQYQTEGFTLPLDNSSLRGPRENIRWTLYIVTELWDFIKI